MQYVEDPIRGQIAKDLGKTRAEVNTAWTEAGKQAKYLIMGNPTKYDPKTYGLGTPDRISLIDKLTRQILGEDTDGIAPVIKTLP